MPFRARPAHVRFEICAASRNATEGVPYNRQLFFPVQNRGTAQRKTALDSRRAFDYLPPLFCTAIQSQFRFHFDRSPE